MDDSPQAAVTPAGVRDGDPAVLAALIERRGPAVLAFCDAVCEPEVVPRAVAEAFARFRALVATVEDTGGLDPEAYLLGATRHAAASMARPPSDGRGVLRALGRGTSPETYAAVPALLAARADSMLGAEDLERLSRLLERSAGCREVEAAFRRAERGYRSPPDKPLSAKTSSLVLDTMQAAAPLAEPFAPEDAHEPAPDQDPDDDDAAVRADAAAAPTADDVVPEPVVPAAAEVVLPDPIDDEEPLAPDSAPTRADDPADLPAPFAPDAHGDAGDDEATHPAVPLTDSAVPEIVAAVPPPTPHGRRLPLRPRLPRGRVPRPSLPSGGGLHLPRREQPVRDGAEDVAVDHGPIYRLILPAVAIVVAVLIMLAIAGVFSSADPSPATAVMPAASVAPVVATTAEPGVVTTPLPATAAPAQRSATPKPQPATSTTTPSVTVPAATPSPLAGTVTPKTAPEPKAKTAPVSRTSKPKRVVVVPADDTPAAAADPVYEPGAPATP